MEALKGNFGHLLNESISISAKKEKSMLLKTPLGLMSMKYYLDCHLGNMYPDTKSVNSLSLGVSEVLLSNFSSCL